MLYSKNKFVIGKALLLMEQTRANPKKYASSKETLLVRVTAILEIALPEFDIHYFYTKHLVTQGFLYLDMFDDYEEDWAYKVIDDAIQILND